MGNEETGLPEMMVPSPGGWQVVPVLMREADWKGVVDLGSELAAETARDGTVPPTERLIIEPVIIMWAQFYAVQIKYERSMYGSHPLKRGRYWKQRLNAAQRRYLRALRTLSNVREMNVTVQINTAKFQQEVNP